MPGTAHQDEKVERPRAPYEDAPSMTSSPDTFYSNSHIIMQRDTEQRSRGHGIACFTDTDVLSTVTQQQEGCGFNSGLRASFMFPFCLCAIVNNNNNNRDSSVALSVRLMCGEPGGTSCKPGTAGTYGGGAEKLCVAGTIFQTIILITVETSRRRGSQGEQHTIWTPESCHTSNLPLPAARSGTSA